MKSLKLAALVWILAVTPSVACEICGCGNSNFQIGVLPYYKKGFLAVRYTTSQFHSAVRGSGNEFSHDYFKTTEIWGGFSVNRFQFMGFVPYVSSVKVSDDGTTGSRGAGDVLLLINYKLFSSTTLSGNEKYSLGSEVFIGGGIKLPTGVSRVDTNNADFNIGDFNSQAGTGSVDYLLNATHNLRWGRSGVVTNAAVRFNTANRQEYRFGNRGYLSLAYYYGLNVGSTRIKPSIGFNYQSNKINTYRGDVITDSNGYNFNSTIGVNILYNKLGINTQASIPVAQNMYDGQTKLISRLLIGMTYSF